MNSPSYFQPELDRREGERLVCDLCIYGATSAGIAATVEARARGLTVVLLANGTHLGGLTTGGLGCTDFGNKSVIGGLAGKFYRDAGAEYGLEEEWFFEPSAARRVFDRWLREAGAEPVLHQFLDSAQVEDGRIRSVRMLSGLTVEAGFFMDATYEGDLMAAAGVPFTTGREGNARYGELLNGVQLRDKHQFEFPVSPWRKEGDPASGLLPGISPEPLATQGAADKLIQAYNFRMCLTQSADRVPFQRPDGYEPERYELLARYLRGGWRELFRKYDPIQGGKTDTNNHGAVSSDFIGENHDYPEAGYARRETIFQTHVNYHQGLLWFYCHDERVPADVRLAMNAWGLAGDEFTDSGHWPPQLYVREARRMLGDYVVTEMDYRGYRRADDSVGCGAYGMDSHNCQRVVVDGRVLNEGDVQLHGYPPYPISYRSVVPPRGSVGNLFVPVCMSASHIAYGSVRMEPVFMGLAQSCAVAAALCRARGCAVQEFPYAELQPELLATGQVLQPVEGQVQPFEPPPSPRVLQKPRVRHGVAAFTLTELLVVLAIIAVLAAILVPVFQRVSANSKTALCTTKLKGITTAWLLYANEHNGLSVNYASDPSTIWCYKLIPYLTNGSGTLPQDAFSCPAAPQVATSPPYGTTTKGVNAWMGVANGYKNLGYGINQYWYSDPEVFSGANAEVIGQKFYKRLLNAKNTEGPIFSDATWVDYKRDGSVPSNYTSPGVATCAVARHNGRGINMSFFDGSVRFVSMGELFTKIKLNPSEQLDPAASNQVPSEYR